jgi:Catalase-related immune-responsive
MLMLIQVCAASNTGHYCYMCVHVRAYKQVFDEGAKDRLTTNIAGHLGGAAEFIQERMIGVLKQVDPDYGQRVQDKIAAAKVCATSDCHVTLQHRIWCAIHHHITGSAAIDTHTTTCSVGLFMASCVAFHGSQVQYMLIILTRKPQMLRLLLNLLSLLLLLNVTCTTERGGWARGEERASATEPTKAGARGTVKQATSLKLLVVVTSASC